MTANSVQSPGTVVITTMIPSRTTGIVVVMLLCVRGYEIRDGKASSLETCDIAPSSGAPRETIEYVIIILYYF